MAWLRAHWFEVLIAAGVLAVTWLQWRYPPWVVPPWMRAG
jgi:hypothetical protein